MKSWDRVRERIESVNRDYDSKWRSNAKYLHMIIDKAEAWDIDPAFAEEATISNLSEIVPEARKAARRGKHERLEELFRWAKEKTNKQLRIDLRGHTREMIKVDRIDDELGTFFRMTVSEDQFERIEKATEENYIFEIKEK
jgi:hypothetical protein